MSIRNTTKALVVHQDKVLVNLCRKENTGEIYYDLPSGGQHPFETMDEAVLREVLEETGYRVRMVRFAALCEEIHISPAMQQKYPDYTHRVAHIFLTEIAEGMQKTPAEKDYQQEGSCWVTLAEADKLPFLPQQLTGRISQLIHSQHAFYLGASFVNE